MCVCGVCVWCACGVRVWVHVCVCALEYGVMSAHVHFPFNLLFTQNTKEAQEHLKKVLSVLNKTLQTRTFLVGERVTLADISIVCNLLLGYKQVGSGEYPLYIRQEA